MGTHTLEKGVLDKNGETLLIVLLSPHNCTPTAMAIQAHQPERVLIISAHFSHENKDQVSEAKSRLGAWMEGADELVSTFESLLEPFPVPHTKPLGYLGGTESGTEVEWRDCHVDDISDVVSERCSDYEGEVRFDILPGAKDPVLGIILGHESADYSLWYTLETGGAVQLKSPGSGEDSIEGPYLSIIDRAWLGGYPVHAKIRREHPPPDDESSLLRDITKSLALEPPDPDAKPKFWFDRAFSPRPDGFITNIQAMGYEASRETSGRKGFVVIRRGARTSKIWCEDLVSKIKPGQWLENLVEAELWNSWEPTETILGLSVIEPSSKARAHTFSRLWKKTRNNFEGNGITTHGGREFAEACERHSLDTACDIEDLITAEMDRLKSAEIIDDEERISFVRVCEIDTALLDAHGVSTFDAKVVFNPGTAREPLQKALQMPKWLLPSQYFVISSIHPPMSHKHPYRVIHIQRLADGRSVLDDDDSAFPRDLPDFVNFVRERTWKEPDGCKFEVPGSFDFEYIPPGKLVNLESKAKHNLGTILYSGGFSVFNKIRKSGYIPNAVEGFELKNMKSLVAGNPFVVVDEDGAQRRMNLRVWQGRFEGVIQRGNIISSIVEIELENGETQERKLDIKVLESGIDGIIEEFDGQFSQKNQFLKDPSNIWFLDDEGKPDLTRVNEFRIYSRPGKKKIKTDENDTHTPPKRKRRRKQKGGSYNLGEKYPEFMSDLKKIKRDSKSNKEGE